MSAQEGGQQHLLVDTKGQYRSKGKDRLQEQRVRQSYV